MWYINFLVAPVYIFLEIEQVVLDGGNILVN